MGTNPSFVACDPTGKFVYVVNNYNYNVQAYTINQSTGALTSVGTTATGTNPWSVACDPTGKFVYVTNGGGNTVQAYTINQTTGALTSVGSYATGSFPWGISCDPTGKFVYVANGMANTVQAYRISNFGTGSGYFLDAVGIGTTTPGTALEVYGSITSRPASTNDAIIISGRAGGTSSYSATFLS